MKNAFLMVLFIWPVVGLAQSPTGPTRQELARERKALRQATDLFTAGRSAEAVAHLRANGRPETISDGETTAVVQSLVMLGTSLRNQGQTRLAKEVAGEAFTAADSILKNRSAAPAWRRAQIFNALGSLCETLFYDLEAARSYYDAAAVLDPKQASPRRQIVSEKIRRRLVRAKR